MTWVHFVVGLLVLALVGAGAVVWLRHRDTNVITGTLRNSHGRAMPGVELLLTSGMAEVGGKHVVAMTDGNGNYTAKLPRGSYAVAAYATMAYEGQEVQVRVRPRVPGSDSFDLPKSGGADLDLVLGVSGPLPETTASSAEDFYGGVVAVTEWFDVDGVGQPLSVLRGELEVTFHFEPVGPLLDGSSIEPFDVTRTVNELVSGSDVLDHDEELYDIPLGSYLVTASLATPAGDALPLLLQDPLGGGGQLESVTITLAMFCQYGCGDIAMGVSLPVGISSTYL
jgi:hypothetical protein